MMINKGSNMFILITRLELDYNINILQHLYMSLTILTFHHCLMNTDWLDIFVSIV